MVNNMNYHLDPNDLVRYDDEYEYIVNKARGKSKWENRRGIRISERRDRSCRP